MAARTSVVLVADIAAYESGMARAATISEETGKKIGTAGVTAGAKFGTGVEKGTSKAGSAFEGLGNTLGNWGLPFSNNLKKIGTDLDNIKTRGKGVAEAFSAVGGVTIAALVGIGAESVHLSDQFETAQVNLQTAIKNSGNSVGAYKSQIDAAYASAAKLGFENNDVAEALQTLTTATQDPAKALADLSTVENIARLRHLSLADASTQLAKILGGNTRILQQWGINLDIGSGKLHSIQSAEESLQKAQLNLKGTQAEISSGQATGARASLALASAQLSVRNATLNLQQSQQAIPDILDAINQRTKNVADNYGKTFPGELKTAEAEIHNLGVDFGEYLLPKINAVLAVGGALLGFFESNRVAADALGIAIGVVLGGAVGVFAYTRAVAFIRAIQTMGDAMAALQLKVAASRAGMLAIDGTIVATGEFAEGAATKMEIFGASFTALLGPIGIAAAALIAFYEISKPTALAKDDVVSAITPQSLQKQMQLNIKNKVPFDAAGFNATLKQTKGYVKGESLTDVKGKAVLSGVPESANQKLLDSILHPKTPGSTIPNLGGVPNVSAGGSSTNAALTAAQLALELSGVKQNENLKLATNTAAGGSLQKLVDSLTAVHKAGFEKLINALNATGNASLTKLAATMQTTLATALTKLTNGDTLAAYAKANAAEIVTASITGNTTASTNEGSAAVGISGLQSQAMIDKLNSAATAINDAAKLQSDAAQAQIQAIQAQTTAMADATSAQVAAINDQTQTQVDTLAERGLYGLALEAQLAKVAIDQQKAIDDAAIAQAQAHLDQVTAQTNAAALQAQQNSDLVQQQADAEEAAALARADSVGISSAINIAAAQATADQAAITAAINNAAAQAHVDAVQFGSQQQQQQASAQQKLIQSQGDKSTALAGQTLANVTAASNQANSDAQNAYSQSQAYWSQMLASAGAALATANDNASIQQALAQASLGAIQNNAAVTEAKLTSIYNVDQEMASTQFAGGYVVNIYAQEGDGAEEYVSALGWALRTRTG